MATRVAVVGTGRLGGFHSKIYAQNEKAQLVCVVDADKERAGQVALANQCEVADSIDDLPDGVEAVSICVPTIHHAEVAIPLLERGIHCLVEKPLAANIGEADRMLAAAKKGGAILSVGHVERFQPGVRKLREMGVQPKFIECHRLAPFSFRSMDIGVVHDLMIHDLDLVLHFVQSEIESFDAAGGNILTDQEDVASVRLVFQNGARANVTASRASMKPMRRFRMFSATGYVSLDFVDNHGLSIQKGPEWEKGREELRKLDPAELATRADLFAGGVLGVNQLELSGEERPLQAELDDFLDAVIEGKSPEVTGEDGRRALDLADQISARIAEQSW